jgi:hypothetical protein
MKAALEKKGSALLIRDYIPFFLCCTVAALNNILEYN